MIDLVDFHAVEHAEKIEMPPRAAELAVGRDFEPDLLLLFDDLLDLAVFDLLELSRAELALFPFRARFFQRCGAQQAADDVGAKRRLGSGHSGISPCNGAPVTSGDCLVRQLQKCSAIRRMGAIPKSPTPRQMVTTSSAEMAGGERRLRNASSASPFAIHLSPGVAKQRAQNRCRPVLAPGPDICYVGAACAGWAGRTVD